MSLISKHDTPLTEAGMYSNKICFVLLHKNAHTVMEHILKDEGLKKRQINVCDKSVLYSAIIRNPLERWIDGLATYFFNMVKRGEVERSGAEKLFRNERDLELLFSSIELDIHTGSQTRVISEIQSGIKLFPIEYINKLIDYFAEFDIKISSIPHEHSITDEADDLWYYKFKSKIIKLMNDNKKYQEIINKHFEKDLILYGGVFNEFWMKYGEII